MGDDGSDIEPGLSHVDVPALPARRFNQCPFLTAAVLAFYVTRPVHNLSHSALTRPFLTPHRIPTLFLRLWASQSHFPFPGPDSSATFPPTHSLHCQSPTLPSSLASPSVQVPVCGDSITSLFLTNLSYTFGSSSCTPCPTTASITRKVFWNALVLSDLPSGPSHPLPVEGALSSD